MGRLDVAAMRYMTAEEFRVLRAVEAGMRNHELVSTPLTCSLANLRSGGAHKIIRQLQNNKLLAYERGKRYDGYRLTVRGYDFLALHSLVADNLIDGFGNQIGTGKESDVYAAYDTHGETLVLKFHRLGRISFRKLKLLRDYHRDRSHMSWLYLSTLSAKKEFTYMKALYERGFPVPRPVQQNRHALLMSIVEGVPLCELRELNSPQKVYAECMDLMIRLAECGVVHCDFNEFNLIVTEDEHVVLIDFPQMVSTSHINAEHLFQRDVNCLRRFFERRFRFASDEYPVFTEVVRTEDMDNEIRASGHTMEFDDFDSFNTMKEDDGTGDREGSNVGDDNDDDDSDAADDNSDNDDDEDKKYKMKDGTESAELSPQTSQHCTRNADEGIENEEDDNFEDAVESPLAYLGGSDLLHTPQSFPLVTSVRMKLRSETDDSNEEQQRISTPLPSSSDSESEVDAAERRRQLRLLKQQRLEQQRSAVRSELSAAVARSAAQRTRGGGGGGGDSTAASTIASDVLHRRLARQQRRAHSRQVERLRAKGDASAVTRQRRANADNIRDSTTGFWGYD